MSFFTRFIYPFFNWEKNLKIGLNPIKKLLFVANFIFDLDLFFHACVKYKVLKRARISLCLNRSSQNYIKINWFTRYKHLCLQVWDKIIIKLCWRGRVGQKYPLPVQYSHTKGNNLYFEQRLNPFHRFYKFSNKF